MYLSEFRVFSYKSFLDSGPIKLKPGFNILTGQNNAGKTALLEGLSLQFYDRPHRSLVTAPTPLVNDLTGSRALFRVVLTQEEFGAFLDKRLGAVTTISIPRGNFRNSGAAWDVLSKQHEIQLEVAVYGGPEAVHERIKFPQQLFKTGEIKLEWLTLYLRKYAAGPVALESGSGSDHHASLALVHGFASRIYSFRAERLNVGRSKFGNDQELRPDASNLPEVLHVLQSTNPARFRRYNSFVKQIFPQVEWVNTRPLANNQVEILVWSVHPDTERADLAVPLSESGTGISQVLAMLYVLVTADSPRTIIIDEPNSFLHPGAVRVLVEILRDHSQHQYIITTHSPELISASNPSTVHILRRSQGQTQVESVDTREARHLRALLMEVGSRFSDVFGAESVLWVEGPTEQLCYPLIVRKILSRSLAGVTIVGVLHTGDFDAKTDTKSVFRIYERLTQGSALLPPAMAFIFDRELRPERDREDLRRQSKGKVHFLSRRTYENYLLHPGAIAAVMNENPPFTTESTLPEKVQAWLAAHWEDSKYYGKMKSQNQVQDIDAPKLLSDLFSELSGARLEYDKVEHSVALTEWLIKHAPDELKELASILDQVLSAAS